MFADSGPFVDPADVYRFICAGDVQWYTELSRSQLEYEIRIAKAMGEDYHVTYYWIVPRIINPS